VHERPERRVQPHRDTSARTHVARLLAGLVAVAATVCTGSAALSTTAGATTTRHFVTVGRHVAPSAHNQLAINATGYDMVGTDGGVFVFPPGKASGFYGSLPGIGIVVNNIVGMVGSPTGKGYFLVGRDGGVFAFGDAGFYGSLPGLDLHLNDIVGIIPTSDGLGYFLVGADGGVFTFGDAVYVGSLPGIGVSVNDVVGIAATPDNKGYWVLENDGTITNFGTAPPLTSLVCPPGPGQCGNLVAIVADNTGQGAWALDQYGNVYQLGDAPFYGDLSTLGAAQPSNIVSLVPYGNDTGYWIIGGDGGIFGYNAPYLGSLPSLGVVVNNIVGAVPTA
jgi:hypothetical protein